MIGESVAQIVFGKEVAQRGLDAEEVANGVFVFKPIEAADADASSLSVSGLCFVVEGCFERGEGGLGFFGGGAFGAIGGGHFAGLNAGEDAAPVLELIRV